MTGSESLTEIASPSAAVLPQAATARFRQFVAPFDAETNIVVLHDSDADGVTAGVVLQRALERSGSSNVRRVIPDRFRDAWSPPNRALVRAAEPDALFVLDLGVRDEPLVDAPTCFIDHHHPDGVPTGATVISAYDVDPVPNTSLMCFELARSISDVSDLDWVAAIGTLSDLGEKAPFAIISEAKRRYGAKDLKELATLINAARRGSIYDPESAAKLLLEHQSPRSALTFGSPELARMQNAREEVKVAMYYGKKAAPKFSGEVALVRVTSPCQIHPLLAQIWRSRLPKFYVLVANDGYLPGRVNFAARSTGEKRVLQFLRSFDIDAGEGSFARGHDHASGGSLPIDAWNQLLEAMGFSDDVFARPPG